jgi:hypothetical protein
MAWELKASRKENVMGGLYYVFQEKDGFLNYGHNGDLSKDTIILKSFTNLKYAKEFLEILEEKNK